MFILVIIGFSLACQKAQRDEDTSVNTCEDIFLAQTVFSDAYKQIRIAAFNAQGISQSDSTAGTIYGCEDIDVDTLSNPKTITINYKFIGCEGLGAVRNGRLIGSFIGKFPKSGSAVDISFSNYFFNGFEVDGKIRVIFKDNNAAGQEVHTFYLQQGSIYDGKTTMTWTASQNWTIDVSGKNEAYTVNGNSNGINRKGNTFKSEITKAYEMSEECLYVLSGSEEIKVTNLSTRNLDYGGGTCDEAATAEINGATYGVKLPSGSDL